MMNKPSQSLEEGNAAVFDRVWYLVSRNYFDDTFGGVDWQASRERFRPVALAARSSGELYDLAIWPMLDQIKTSHVDALSPRSAGIVDTSPYHFSSDRGEAISDYSGAGDLGGADAIYDGSRWVVYTIRKASPAEKAGIRPGDEITSVRVKPVRDGDMPVYEADLNLESAAGEARKVSYRYNARIKAPQRKTTSLSSGAVVIRFDIFEEETVDWALKALKEAGDAPLILDLRENRGGNIGQLQRFASALLPDRVSLGVSTGRIFPSKFALWTHRDGREYGGPIAVLIGPKTASAGEIVSYNLHKLRNAPLVGERTAGAVLTSRDWKLPDGGTLYVATGNFVTADDQRLEGVGVSPTIEVTPTLEAIREGRDLAIEAAERALLPLVIEAHAPDDMFSSAPVP